MQQNERKASRTRSFQGKESQRERVSMALQRLTQKNLHQFILSPIYNCSSKLWYSGIRFEMGRNSIIIDENPIRWHLGMIVQIKNTKVWETQDRVGIVQYGDSSEECWTWLSQIEDNGGKKYRADSTNWEKLEAKNVNYEETPWSRIRRQNSVGSSTGSVLEETIAVSATQSNASLNSFMQQNERKASRTRSFQGKESSGRMSRWPCTNSFCEKWHPPECLFYKSENGCKFNKKCSYAHRQVDEQPSKNFFLKKKSDKNAMTMLKNTRQLGFVFQDMEPPKYSSILRNSSNMQKPILCVQFTKSRRTSCWHSRPKSVASGCLPKWWNGKSDVPVKQRESWLKAS